MQSGRYAWNGRIEEKKRKGKEKRREERRGEKKRKASGSSLLHEKYGALVQNRETQ